MNLFEIIIVTLFIYWFNNDIKELRQEIHDLKIKTEYLKNDN